MSAVKTGGAWLALFSSLLLAGQPDIEHLYRAGNYQQVIQRTSEQAALTADQWFFRGMALARLERWQQAREALAAGAAAEPGDARFQTELAGVAYRLDQHSEARKRLRRALRLDPADTYSRNFLATLYLLDENLDAALQQWNRIDQPYLATVETPAASTTDRILLDRAFAAAPASRLELDDVRRTRARLDLLDVFRSYQFDLPPAESKQRDRTYRLRLRGFERGGWGPSKLLAAASWLRGLPYQTVFPQFENLRGRAVHLRSLLRWDRRKRRAAVAFAAPLGREATRRWRLFADARDEQWSLARDSPEQELGDFKMQVAEAGAGFDAVLGPDWLWSAEAAASVRSFSGVPAGLSHTPNGAGARAETTIRWTALRLPAHRLELSTDGRLGVGRTFVDLGGLYSRSEAAVSLDWRPGRHWHLEARASTGRLDGPAPLDELYSFGVERDNTLWLRGLRGTRDGKKGAAGLGDRHGLFSADLTRALGGASILEFRAGPFLDAGALTDSRNSLPAPGARAAAGLRIDVQVFGSLGVSLLWGHELGSGKGLLYTRPIPSGRSHF